MLWVRGHAIHSAVSWLGLTITFGIVYPLLYFLVTGAPKEWYPVYALLFFITRLSFEGLLSLIARKLGADIMPLAVFFGVSAFEVASTMTIVKCHHLGVAVEMVLLDLLVHLYYVWCLHRAVAAYTDSAHILRILVVLVVRELAQIMVPSWYVVIQTAAYNLQPSFNSIVSYMGYDLFLWATWCVLAKLGFQIGVCIFTHWYLQHLRQTPMLLLRAVVKINLINFVCAINCVSLFMLTLQHTHWGWGII